MNNNVPGYVSVARKKPLPRQGLDGLQNLEAENGSELNASRAAAADEWVSDSHVASGADNGRRLPWQTQRSCLSPIHSLESVNA